MIGMWGEYSALVPYLDRTEEISGDIKQEPKAHLCKLNKSKGRVKKKYRSEIYLLIIFGKIFSTLKKIFM